MRRVVEPELLDALAPDDPQAVASRADLRRMNVLMGTVGVLTRAYRDLPGTVPSQSRSLRLVELGAGDGTLLLRLARRWSALGVRADATLLDRQDLVSAETRHAFDALQWSVETVTTDVFDWLGSPGPAADVMVSNLFLHHFQDEQLATLLKLAAAKTNLFIACEPCRSTLAFAAAHCLGFLGCNAVTRHDAVVSVRAGFTGKELSNLWPRGPKWELREQRGGLFNHSFAAQMTG